MAVPCNIQELSDKNELLLAKLNFRPEVDDPFDLCNEPAYLRTGLFPEEIIPLMFREGSNTEQATNQLSRIAKGIGMILIRPDMVHVSRQFETFISERFEIIHTDFPKVDRLTYWQMYKHDIYRPETMHSRLTRAALYIGSRCRLIVFQASNMAAASEPIADYTKNSLRGNQGIFQRGTLRGDIVYRNALHLGLHRLNNRDIDPRIKIATDPFAAYRKLAANPDHSYQSLAYPLLFFTGVGVHVPDYIEIDNDLPLFLKDLKPYLASEASEVD